AAALGGVAAGDPRRWKDASTSLAVVVATTTPDEVRRRFAALPEIVATDGDVGLTLDGTQVMLVTTPAESFGTALLRATGSPEYVAELEPLPEASGEAEVYAQLGVPYLPPELREFPAPVEPPELVSVEQV